MWLMICLGVQRVIRDMSARLKSPDLARLFENTFPSTLDTTVKCFDPDRNLAFIVTGVSWPASCFALSSTALQRTAC